VRLVGAIDYIACPGYDRDDMTGLLIVNGLNARILETKVL